MKKNNPKEDREKASTNDGVPFTPAQWRRPKELLFSQWVREMSSRYRTSTFNLEVAASQLGVSVAALDACLHLDQLGDESLAVMNGVRPPLSVWYLLSRMEHDKLKEAMQIIEEHRKAGFHEPITAVLRAKLEMPMTKLGGMSKVTPEAYHIAEKLAQKHDVLTPKARNALKGFGKWLSDGKTFSIKQDGYARSLVLQLKEASISSTNPKEQARLQELYSALD